jgi:putative CocE/NonD family hydrolase
VRGDGSLSTVVPAEEPPDRFEYDPRSPVPTIGGSLPGANPNLRSGVFDQREIEARSDVLVYSTPPLEADVEVTGPVEVVLYASSSARDTDFTAKLVDVDPDGRAFNLTDGIIRARYRRSVREISWLEPGAVVEYRIDLVATSNLFKRGHRIRVEISSSNFPRFSRNLNTEGEFATNERVVVAQQTVFHDRRRPSSIILPIVPARDVGRGSR